LNFQYQKLEFDNRVEADRTWTGDITTKDVEQEQTVLKEKLEAKKQRLEEKAKVSVSSSLYLISFFS
jgi:hypothetical protein